MAGCPQVPGLCGDDRVPDSLFVQQRHGGVEAAGCAVGVQNSAEAVAPGFGISADEALEAGLALVGSVDEICDLMESRRDRWGVSYAVVGGDEMEMFAPVVERLAGH